MPKNNWEHYHLDDDNQDSKEFNPNAYSFYDFSDEEVKQMEDDRIASLSKPDNSDTESTTSVGSNASPSSTPSAEPIAARATAKERTQKFKMNGTEGSDFTAV